MTSRAAILDVPPVWRAVVSELNGGRIPDGEPGIRDVDAPCEEFQPEGPEAQAPAFSDCETDGHYLCKECVHISERALRRRRDECEDCGEKLVQTIYGKFMSLDVNRCPACDPHPEDKAS